MVNQQITKSLVSQAFSRNRWTTLTAPHKSGDTTKPYWRKGRSNERPFCLVLPIRHLIDSGTKSRKKGWWITQRSHQTGSGTHCISNGYFSFLIRKLRNQPVADDSSVVETWLPVIGNALAFLCLDKYAEKNPDKVDTVLKKVGFLEGLGVPSKDAAAAAGSNANSVRVLKAKGNKRASRK